MTKKGKHDEDLIRLKLENKGLEEDLENLIMKNNVLLKMNQSLREENSNFAQSSKSLQSIIETLRYELETVTNNLVERDDLDRLLQEKIKAESEAEKYEEICSELNSQLKRISEEHSSLKRERDRIQADVSELRSELTIAAKREIEFEDTIEEIHAQLESERRKYSDISDMLVAFFGQNWTIAEVKFSLHNFITNKGSLESEKISLKEAEVEVTQQLQQIESQARELRQKQIEIETREKELKTKKLQLDNQATQLKQKQIEISLMKEELEDREQKFEEKEKISQKQRVEQQFSSKINQENLARERFMGQVSESLREDPNVKIEDDEGSELEDIADFEETTTLEEMKKKLRESSLIKIELKESSKLEICDEDDDLRELGGSDEVYPDDFLSSEEDRNKPCGINNKIDISAKSTLRPIDETPPATNTKEETLGTIGTRNMTFGKEKSFDRIFKEKVKNEMENDSRVSFSNSRSEALESDSRNSSEVEKKPIMLDIYESGFDVLKRDVFLEKMKKKRENTQERRSRTPQQPKEKSIPRSSTYDNH